MDTSYKPLISVMISAFNRKDFIIQAAKSALNQTLSNEWYEIVVVKNFMDSEVENFLEREGVRSVLSKEDLIGAFFLDGIKECRGDFIAFMDDDDEWDEKKLELVFEILEQHPSIVFPN